MSNDLDDFARMQELEQGPIGLGLVEDARWLHGTMAVAYTTSSEMLGEIGAMIRRIHRSIPAEAKITLRSEFEACARLVRIAWPKFVIDDLSNT